MRIHDRTPLVDSLRTGAADVARAPSTGRAAMKEVEVRFGAALLEAAMPKGKASFGTSLAGTVAREKMIEHIARIVADNGGLGIARLADGAPASARPRGD